MKKQVIPMLLLLSFLSACALVEEVKNTDTNVNLFSNDNFTRQVRDRGDVLLEREEGEMRVIVMREGDDIIKYHIYDVQEKIGLEFTNTRTEEVAIIKTKTKTCFQLVKKEHVEVDCMKLKEDIDLEKYLP
jgi:hypothetical protein